MDASPRGPVSNRDVAAWRDRLPAILAGASAAVVIVSIAASQILLGLAIIAILASRAKLRWPPVAIPLLLWMTWTLVSVVANGHERQGYPQIKKFYVYLTLFAVYTAIRTVRQIRWIALGWVLGGSRSEEHTSELQSQ